METNVLFLFAVGKLSAIVLLILLGATGELKSSSTTKVVTQGTTQGCTEEISTLTLLHVNDHHSYIEQSGYFSLYDLPQGLNASTAEEIRVYHGGYPRLVTLMNGAKAYYEGLGHDVLKLHAGDAITGTTYFTLFKGEADAAMMAHACFDAFALGNHEFDEGDAGLAKFMKDLISMTKAKNCSGIPVLSANLVPHKDSALKDEVYEPYTIVGDVGIIGITIAKKTMESSQPDEGTIILDEIESTEKYVAELTEKGIKKIVLLTHVGYDNDLEWLASIDGVDVVVGGDSHSLLGGNSVELAGTSVGSYGTIVEQPCGGKACVVQAWEYSKVLGVLTVNFDNVGNLINCTGVPDFPLDPDRYTVRSPKPRFDVIPSDAALLTAHLGNLSYNFFPVAKDEATLNTVLFYKEQVDDLKKTVIASVPVPISESERTGGGSCDLVAKAFLYVTPTADVTIQNRGGCRSGIDDGNFTINDAYTMLPFSNTLVTLEMTGVQVQQVLEDAVDYATIPGGSWGAYPHSSGLKYDIDINQPVGSRVSNVEVNPRLESPDGFNPIDPEGNYVVVTNNFIATPRDGYYEFGNIADDKIVNTYTEYAKAFIDYATELGTIVGVPEEEHSIKTYILPTADE